MRVHHLNCITTCPLGADLKAPRSKDLLRGRLVCHCVLVETDRGLVLLDTGLGLRDVAHPEARLSPFFLSLLRPEFREEMTAIRQIERLGFDPGDVRHIVLTHLDFDHAGGLDDFPHAQVHLLATERDSAEAQKTRLDRMRYRPQQWSTRANWSVYPSARGDTWFGFTCVRNLAGVTPEILLVPLLGHTLGHTGIAVQRPEGWLLLAGDAYFYHGEMNLRHPVCPAGLVMYQTLMEKDRSARITNQRRLRELRRDHGRQVTIVCSHDIIEFEQVAGRPYEVPATLPEAASPPAPPSMPRPSVPEWRHDPSPSMR